MLIRFLVLALMLIHHSSAVETKTFLRAYRSNLGHLDRLRKIVNNEYPRNKQASQSFNILQGAEQSERNFMKLNRDFSSILFDGDIIISDARLREIVEDLEHQQSDWRRLKRWAYRDLFYPGTIWQTGVPYEFDTDLPPVAVDSIKEAMNFWQNNTCVTFRPRANEIQYAFFTGSMNMCSSSVGRDTSTPQQEVFIGPGCYKFGVTSHEVGHLLGLFHHHQRYDRDEYVTFYPENVVRSDTGNFATVSSRFLDTYGLPYDVGSVMHYAPTEFAINRFFPAMKAVNENLQGSMGQMEGPSFLDVQIINRHYRCNEACNNTEVQPNCLNGGYVDPLNCSVCKCPTGFGGDVCQLIASSAPLRCGGLIPTTSKLTRLRISSLIGQKMSAYSSLAIAGLGQYCYRYPHRKGSVRRNLAPPNRRVMIGIETINGKCQEGCYTSAMEVKMDGDFRPVGFRYCCQSQSFRRILSKGRNVPVIFFAQNSTLEVLMFFRWVVLTPDAEDDTSLNSTELMEVYQQSDDDNGMDMQLLQLPGGTGTPGGGASELGKNTANDEDSAQHLFYGGDGESYEDFSIYT